MFKKAGGAHVGTLWLGAPVEGLHQSRVQPDDWLGQYVLCPGVLCWLAEWVAKSSKHCPYHAAHVAGPVSVTLLLPTGMLPSYLHFFGLYFTKSSAREADESVSGLCPFHGPALISMCSLTSLLWKAPFPYQAHRVQSSTHLYLSQFRLWAGFSAPYVWKHLFINFLM